MKNYVGFLLSVLLVLATTPVFASDGNVSPSTLTALGLGGIQIMSDADGLEIRGMSSNAAVSGGSLVVGVLVDPLTSSFLVLSDTNGYASSAENAGLNAISIATGGPAASGISGTLDVNFPLPVFFGSFIGGAGGLANTSAN